MLGIFNDNDVGLMEVLIFLLARQLQVEGPTSESADRPN